MRVAMVDSGGHNLASVQAAFARLGVAAAITADPAQIRAADRVVLPGVGAAGASMDKLRRHGLVELIRSLEQPVLGVCVGMQLLFEWLDEDDCAGLGLIPGRVSRLASSPGVRVPHSGWTPLRLVQPHPLLAGLSDPAYAYFVHSYAAPIGPHTLAAADHGQRFSAIVGRDRFVGLQCHPERSAVVGAMLLANFLKG